MSDPTDSMVVPPGWYADPYGRAIQRYFNGSAWTAYVIDATGCEKVDDPAAAVPAAGPQPTANAGKGAIVIQNVIAPQPVQPLVAWNMAASPEAKSPGLAVLLAFLFGPLGLLYVNVIVAVVLTIAAVLLYWTIIVPLGIWVASMIYAHTEATKINSRLVMAAAVSPQPILGAAPRPQWQAQRPPAQF